MGICFIFFSDTGRKIGKIPGDIPGKISEVFQGTIFIIHKVTKGDEIFQGIYQRLFFKENTK